MMNTKLKIALRACAGSSWFGGVNYINNLGNALLDLPEEQRPELWILSEEGNFHNLEHYVDLLLKCSGLAFIGSKNPIEHLKQIPCKIFADPSDLEKAFDAVFPLVSSAWDHCNVALSWIPDFQHLYYPNFFTSQEIESRNYHFARATKLSKGLILSSQDAKNDLEKFDPHRKNHLWVLPFHSKLSYNKNPQRVQDVRIKLKIPLDYICCINQFWAHKDHETLFKALGILKNKGIVIPLICTGAKTDYRNEAHFTYLNSILEHYDLLDQVKILGHIDREDQIQMIRGARFVVQPSLFEGWSTVLEDCRSLGKTVLASNLGVHLEQSPLGMRTFIQRDPVSLSNMIIQMWGNSQAGPHLEQEEQADHLLSRLIHDYALNFCNIVKEFAQNDKSSYVEINQMDSKYPKISVVTPNFNQGQYLEKCITSVLGQGYPNLEYIIIDGGSTDNSVEIIKKYADQITYWVSEKDRGQSHAINKGLEKSTGEIWVWLNGDDWYEEGALFKVAETYQKNPNASAWVGACHRLHDNGWLHYVSYPNGLYKDHLGNNWNCRQFYQPSCFFNRKLVNEVGGLREDLHFTMDIDLFLRLLSKAPFVKGEGIWSTALAQTDAKTVKQMDLAFTEHASLDESWGFPRGAENIRKKISAGGRYSDYVPADSIYQKLISLQIQTPFQAHQRKDVLFISDWTNQNKAIESLKIFKTVAEIALERAPDHRFLLAGPGAEQWKHIEIPGKVEILTEINFETLKAVLTTPQKESELFYTKISKQCQNIGIPIISLQGEFTPIDIVDGVNGFIAQNDFDFAYKTVLMLIEPSVFGSMSAMTALDLKDFHSLHPFQASTQPDLKSQAADAPNAFESVSNLSHQFRQSHSQAPRVHVFIYTWNKREELKETLELLAKTNYPNFKTFVLDNGCSDGSGPMIDEMMPRLFKDYKIIHLPVNIGAAPARNWLWSEKENLDAEYVAYFDDDVLFGPEWLSELVKGLESDPKAGVVGAKILNATGDKIIQHSGGILTKGGKDWIDHVLLFGSVPDQGQFNNISERDYVMGCCNLYRCSAHREIGDFDVQFSPSQFDDVDHHLRLRLKGWKVLFHGGVEVLHKRNSGGAKNANHIANRFKLQEKYAQGDADRILAQNACTDFLQKHPWVRNS